MLLTEDRVSKVKDKYDIPLEVWENMVSGSAAIASNQKYLGWIAGVWDKIRNTYGNDPMRVLTSTLNVVEEFDRVRANLKKKDLYQYSNRQEVIDALENYKLEKTRNIGTHKESEVVFEDNRYKVVVPKSHTASCYYGAGTKWCTASKDTDSHFTSYDKSGKLFYILDKSAPTSDKHYKVALNRTYKGRDTFYDSKDDSITDTNEISDIMSHPELMKRIGEYFTFTYADEVAKISEEEKQVELARIARDAEWAERRRVRELRLQQTADARRENEEWKIGDTDDIGTMANILMGWLVEVGEFDDKSSEIEEVESQIGDLRNDMENDPEVIGNPDGERAQEYGDDLNNLYEEIDVLKEEMHTVYDLRYEDYDHYGMPIFEYEGAEYAVGDDEMADTASVEQVAGLIDDIGYAGFNPSFVRNHVDGDLVADDFEDMFWSDMSDNPEDYLDEDDDRELTSKAEEQLESMKEQVGETQEELEEEEDESHSEYLVGQIEAIEEAMQDIEDDDDNYEWTEEAKESYVEGRLHEVRLDPVDFLENYGYDDFDRYVDGDSFIQDVIDSDGRGNGLSSYDGEEIEVSFEDVIYYIYRIN